MFSFLVDFSHLDSNEEMVKFLIKNGADVNLSNSKSETPLHLAALAGSLPHKK